MRAFGWLCALALWAVVSMFLWSTAGAMITSSSTVGVLLGIVLIVVMLGGLGLVGFQIWKRISQL